MSPTQITAESFDIFEILRDLKPEERAALVPLFKAEVYDAGKVLFREGDPGNKLYFILRGVIQIEKGVDESNSARLARLGHGEVLGEISVMDQSPRTATATAFLDAEVMVISRQQVDSLVTSDPKVAAKIFLGMAQSLARRLRSADDEITQLTKRLYYF